jgi:flagellar FliJ protein
MSDTLQLLLEQAERERDRALGRLRQAEQALQLSEAQAAQLADYREDYRRRAPALNGRVAHIELVRCHHGFMQRLDQAIEQQRATLQRQSQATAALREVLLECEMRVAGMRRLQQQRAAEAAQHATRQEQRHTDEAALRLALRPPGIGAAGGLHATATHSASHSDDEAPPWRH